MSNEKTTDAAAGRLELGVRPVAYVQRMGSYQGVPALGCLLTIEAERRMKVNDPLYDKAALDAAVAAERERLCAAIKAADDKASASDYMLDSDDCIRVIRGTWSPET